MNLRCVCFALIGTITFAFDLVSAGAQGSAVRKRPLTVAAAIETTRAMIDRDGTQVFVSPDGQTYVVMLIRGDLERNGNWLEVLSGSLASTSAARNASTRARLFMSSYGTQFGFGTTLLTFSPYANRVHWFSPERIAFLWGDDANVSQVFSVNVHTGEIRQLTHHETDVTWFDVGRTGVVLFSAVARHSMAKSNQFMREGFVVKNPDLFSALAGNADGYGFEDWMNNNELFVSTTKSGRPRQIVIGGRAVLSVPPQIISLSPDERLAIVDAPVTEVQPSWTSYKSEFVASALSAMKDNEATGRSNRFLKKLHVVDIDNGVSWSLWDAPIDIWTSLSWSPRGNSVAVARTFMPVTSASEAGLVGTAVAEVEVASGFSSEIELDFTVAPRASANVAWLADDRIRVTSAQRAYDFRKRTSLWHAEAYDVQRAVRRADQPVRVQLREDLNTPPTLYAVDPNGGREKFILDLNPLLKETFLLGTVEHVTWPDTTGRSWSGLLYRPVGYVEGKTYPLVVQTHGHAPISQFSLYGLSNGTGPGTPVFAAQALANRDIAVLQVEDKSLPSTTDTPQEVDIYVDAYEAGINYLTKRGLVDRTKVGLAGYSRTGWYVLHAITQSDFPYAAAVVCNPTDPSYVLSAATGWENETFRQIGASPYGSGLAAWLRRSPGFNADRVRAPLQMQSDVFGLPSLVIYWEMFSRLRALGQPTEIYMPPNAERSSHAMQNPAQLRASQERAVDWFDYWLNGHRDDAVTKANTYAEWEALRERREFESKRKDRTASTLVEQ
jgi:dipeptidyl aminopeptidase/acylaminoacyl peptidase